jgi:hypothetical protein
MQYLIRFWYLQSLPWALNRYKTTVASFESQIAVQATWKNIGKPLFQDYTFQGKVIGFFFRLFRIVFGGALYACIALAFAVLYLFWLLLPVLCVISILGFFFATPLDTNYCTCTLLP